MTSQPEPIASAGNPYVMNRDRLEADMSQIAQRATSDSSLAFAVASGEIASGKTRLIPPLL